MRFPGARSRNYRPHLIAPQHDPTPKHHQGCYACGKVAGIDLLTKECANCGLPAHWATKRGAKRWNMITRYHGSRSKRGLKHGRTAGRKVFKRG